MKTKDQTIAVRFLRNYTSKNGKKTFIYELVKPTAEQLEAYAESKGEFFRKDEDSGNALYFTTRYFGKKGILIETSKGEFVPDTSELDQLSSLTNQFGIDVALRMQGGLVNAAPVEKEEEEVIVQEQPKAQTTQRKAK